MDTATVQTCKFHIGTTEFIVFQASDESSDAEGRKIFRSPTHRIGDFVFFVQKSIQPGPDIEAAIGLMNLCLCFEPNEGLHIESELQHPFEFDFKIKSSNGILGDTQAARMRSGGIWVKKVYTEYTEAALASCSGLDIEVSGNFNLEAKVANTPSCVLRSMWFERIFCDFAIVAQCGKEVPCHRSVLSAGSSFFHGLMTSDMAERGRGSANLDEREEVIVAFLEFIYLGSLRIIADHMLLCDLLKLADYASLDGMARACVSRLLGLVNVDTVLDILEAVQSLRHVNNVCKTAFDILKLMLKERDDILEKVCSAVQTKPETFGDAVGSDADHSRPRKVQRQE